VVNSNELCTTSRASASEANWAEGHRLGRLAWAKGSVPTPHGLIAVEVGAESVNVASPVPFIIDLAGQQPRSFPAGRHSILLQSPLI